jgi:beta-lactamase class D
MRILAVSLILSTTLCHAAEPASQIATTFVLRDLDTGATTVDNEAMAARGYLPCSTFKIPNTLIGLDTGVIRGEGFALAWDGVERPIASWNRDHTLATALRDSVVWFFQEVARRIGQKRMDTHLAAWSYGNRKTCCQIDRFWLDGDLRISPREQVEFLERLSKHTVPIDPEHVALVRRLLILAQRPAYTLMGKTGSGVRNGEDLAWLVGWVDTPAHHYVYAYLAVARPGQAPSREQRTALVRERLVQHRVITAE